MQQGHAADWGADVGHVAGWSVHVVQVDTDADGAEGLGSSGANIAWRGMK